MKYNILALGIAFLISVGGTAWLIPFMKKKQFGQFIREDGPQAHLSKAGTPTMGGIAFILGIAVAIAFTGRFNSGKLMIILTMLAYGVIGFVDDYNKIAKKQNEGLTPKQKIALQVVFGACIAVYMMLHYGTAVFIPFAKIEVEFGWVYIPFIIFVEVAMSNAVNLTDGLDGLASSTSAIVAACFSLIASLWFGLHSNNSAAIAGAAVVGGLLGFLVFNHYPAKIFMGDTGSMALGGVLSAIAIVGKFEFLLPIAGLLFVIEALSVIIQVTYFKKTGGKRFFKMAPIHHHFELCGWSEVKIVVLFSVFTMICCVIACLAAL